MRLEFRQGIVSHQSGDFLNINPSLNVDLLASNRPVTVTIAHRDSNYTHIEDNDVANAWQGPFSPTLNYWLYWDLNQLTFTRTFGTTLLEPVAQSVEPGINNASITTAIAGDPGVGTFIVANHYVLQPGRIFEVVGAGNNNGTYTVNSATFNTGTGETIIVVNQIVPENGTTGELTLDIDAFGEVLLQNGRHWYNTVTNEHFVRQNDMWVPILRVFAAQVVNGTTFIPQTITPGVFTGTQIGNTSSILSGRVMFDEASAPLRRDDGTFFTTEDQFFSNASRIDAIRLESNVARAQFPNDNALDEYTVVAWYEDGKAQISQYDDSGTTVVGMLSESIVINEVGGVIIQGAITNPNWNWTTGVSAVPVGTQLWIDNGDLVTYDLHVTNAVAYPIARVPVARVLDNNTVIFEQGLGGVGPIGATGTIEDIPPSSITQVGGVVLTLPPVDSEVALVPGDNDPRLSDARQPLPHAHPGTEVAFLPAAGLTSNTVEGALIELSTDKFDKTGGPVSGFVTLHADPTIALHAATKNYVDNLVNGLVWLEAVCVLNMISDTITAPPAMPNLSDSYIIPPSATGVWSAIPAGNVVTWDEENSVWIDRGPLVGLAEAGASTIRLGISMYSTTIASGTFSTYDNKIAIYDLSGSFQSLETPALNNAVFVCGASDLHAYNQFAFDGTDWVRFGGSGGTVLSVDENTLTQNGNVLEVKQFADGGVNDVQFWQGLEPSDLTTTYAPISHNHTQSDISVLSYNTSPDWGTPVDAAEMNSTMLQSSLEEIYDEKASKTPLYTDLVDLPIAANVHGMFAHVHNEGKAYYAHNGAWVELSIVSHEHTIPYDVNFFLSGFIFPNELQGSFLSTREIFVSNTLGSLAVAEVAPSSSNIIFDINVNGSTIGTLTFVVGSTNGVFSFTDTTLVVGDKMQLVSQVGTVDPTFRDVTVNIVGCANSPTCTL